ncbi:CAT RNA binding domain-containing protein, partial [Clostridioides difficile]|uniref:CAT RNA binding domain-containing protein n=1 Tax=Clostridioides difficile TaxID=1496 RepID=UPI0029C3D272
MVIKKVFNNNVVFAIDNSGQEVILMGKGIGFNKFTKDLVEIDKIEKKFIFNSEESLSELHS